MNITTVDSPSQPFTHRGGYGQIVLIGAITGNTVSFEALYDGISDADNDWVKLLNASGNPIELSVDSSGIPFLAAPCKIRATASGGTEPDLKFFINPLPVKTEERG